MEIIIEILILIAAMVVVGLVVGWLAKKIWKDDRKNDMTIAVITTVIVGLLDYYIVPALGFSDTWKWFWVALEPPLAALFVLWLFRKAKK